MLRSIHIDRGEQTLLVDALNLPFVTNDAKQARSLFAYDNLQRPIFVWARDNVNDKITKRQIMQYGDSVGYPNPENYNLKGKLYFHNDESGQLVYEAYDFKGNNLTFYRLIITDDALTAYQKYVVDWDDFNPAHLSNTKNTITQEYDALNRIRKAVYPEDRAGQRKEMIPKYNKGGALFSLKVDTTDYVKEVAYNARGQRILIAMGNKIMTRYAYDTQTFRVSRQRSGLYTHNGNTYNPDGGVQQDLKYTYDLEGTIKTINDAAPANFDAQNPTDLLRVFTHDPLRRLLSATGMESSNVYKQPSWDLNIRPHDHTKTNTYTRRYAYDKLGNIQSLNHKADGFANQDFGRDYAYDIADNKLQSFTVNSTTYQNKYDDNGNLTQEGQTRYYEWGVNDKLAVFKNQAGNSTPSVYTNYFYNAQGERVKKHTRKGNKIVVTFYMDGGMFETTYTKTVGGSIDNDRYYNTIKVSDDGALIATIQVGKNVDDKKPEIKYIVGDHLNNSTAVLKATTGSLINREEYYPFGETSFGSFQYKRYRYNGKEKDEESGLYEYGQRYYATWVCRFVSVDPIAEDYPQLSSYNYAGNKPICFPDIDGLQSPAEETTPTGGNGIVGNTENYTSINTSSLVINVDNLATSLSSESPLIKSQYSNYKSHEAFVNTFGFAPLTNDMKESLINGPVIYPTPVDKHLTPFERQMHGSMRAGAKAYLLATSVSGLSGIALGGTRALLSGSLKGGLSRINSQVVLNSLGNAALSGGAEFTGQLVFRKDINKVDYFDVGVAAGLKSTPFSELLKASIDINIEGRSTIFDGSKPLEDFAIESSIGIGLSVSPLNRTSLGNTFGIQPSSLNSPIANFGSFSYMSVETIFSQSVEQGIKNEIQKQK